MYKRQVLQTSCRCLRQVIKNGQETALIYLNESNAEKLNMQLERQHHISLKEFSSADNSKGNYKFDGHSVEGCNEFVYCDDDNEVVPLPSAGI